MRNQKIYFLLFFTLLCCAKSFGQLGPVKYKDVAEIQKRNLLVALVEPSEKITAEQAENYNKALMEAVKLHWTTHKTFEAKPSSEVFKLYSEKNTNYSVIKYDVIKVDRMENHVVVDSWNVGNIGFTLIEHAFDKKPDFIMNQPITTLSPTNIDFYVAVKTFQNWMDFRSAKKNIITDGKRAAVENAKTFKTKTLLLNKAFLDPKLTTTEIKEVFPYNYKIVDNEEIEKAILEKDPNYLFVYIAPLNVWNPTQLGQQVLDTQNISMLGISLNTFSMRGASYGQVISKSDFPEYQRYVREGK